MKTQVEKLKYDINVKNNEKEDKKDTKEEDKNAIIEENNNL